MVIESASQFAASWCLEKGMDASSALFADLLQEAELAALRHHRDHRAIVRAMDRYRKREGCRAMSMDMETLDEASIHARF